MANFWLKSVLNSFLSIALNSFGIHWKLLWAVLHSEYNRNSHIALLKNITRVLVLCVLRSRYTYIIMYCYLKEDFCSKISFTLKEYCICFFLKCAIYRAVHEAIQCDRVFECDPVVTRISTDYLRAHSNSASVWQCGDRGLFAIWTCRFSVKLIISVSGCYRFLNRHCRDE